MKPCHGALAALPVALALLASSAGCRPGGGGGAVKTPGAPVVLISVDTLRSDRLPFYGYGKVETPALSALRADGILFEKAYTAVPLTLPAHVTLLTGLLPDRHGVHDNLGYTVRADAPLLAELLRKAGYATGGAVSSIVLKGESGISRGFDLWDDSVAPTRPNQALNRVQRPGGEAEAALEAWVEGVKEKPFFAFLHLYEPHSPYEPPEPFRSRYSSNPYDGEVATADAIVGKLLDFLKARGLYDRALVVFLSDHGEGLGDHGEGEHGLFLYREVLQVPLVVKLPKGAASLPASVATPVQLTDVFTTIAEAAGVEPFTRPPGTVSLLDAARGVPVPSRRLYAETFFPRIHFGWSELRSLLDERWHYVEAPRSELYDLVDDPGEKKDLAPSLPPPFRAMRIEMEKLRTEFKAPASVDPEAAKQLASLGYLSSGATAGAGPLDDPKDHVGTVQEMKDALADLVEGRPAKAVERTDALLRANPRMLDIWELRSQALTRLGRTDESIEALKKTVELAPPGSTHYVRLLANHLLDVGRIDEAIRHAELATRLGDPAGEEILARALLAKGDLAGAERAARASLAAPSNANRGYLVLAQVEVRRNALDRALQLTREAETSGGDARRITGLHALRGDILARMGNPAGAEAELLEEIRLHPAELGAWSSLVLVQAAQGKREEARGTAEKMIASVPGVESYLSAMRVLSVVGEREAARRCQQEGLRRYPGDPRLARLGGKA
ncbi:MAG: sulfatase-like hydrolase/transferase [Thermoanaerobaculia bacterium]